MAGERVDGRAAFGKTAPSRVELKEFGRRFCRFACEDEFRPHESATIGCLKKNEFIPKLKKQKKQFQGIPHI